MLLLIFESFPPIENMLRVDEVTYETNVFFCSIYAKKLTRRNYRNLHFHLS